MPDHLSSNKFQLTPKTTLILNQIDITKWEGGAIINAATERMLGGGGVDGAVHRVAGPQLYEACLQAPCVRPNVRCPTGDAKITPGFGLKVDYVIHTVGPVYRHHTFARAAELLTQCYQACIRLARGANIKTIAFPALSCGVYGYPMNEASEIALSTMRSSLLAVEEGREPGENPISELHIALYDEEAMQEYRLAAQKLYLTPLSSGPGSATDEALV